MKVLPDPATPTVAAPAPINLAAESISLVTAEVWKFLTAGNYNNTDNINCKYIFMKCTIYMRKSIIQCQLYIPSYYT